MPQDILITPKSGEPQILFTGSGSVDTPIELNVLSSYQSATGSGSAIIFQGTEGQLFGITDNLSSGTIFSVSDITGLPSIEFNASGELKLGEYSSSVTGYNFECVYWNSGIPQDKNYALYNDGGQLHFNASGIPFSEPISDASGVLNMMVMSEATYNSLGTKDANTVYFLT